MKESNAQNQGLVEQIKMVISYSHGDESFSFKLRMSRRPKRWSTKLLEYIAQSAGAGAQTVCLQEIFNGPYLSSAA